MSDDLWSVSSPDSNVIHRDFNRAMHQIDDLNRQIDNLDQRNLLAVESMESLKGTIRHQGDVIRDHRLRLTESESEKESLEAKVQSLQQRNVVLKAILTDQAERENAAQRQQIAVLRNRHDELESQNESLEADLRATAAQLSDNVVSSLSLRQENAMLRNCLNASETEKASLEAEVQSARNDVQPLQQQNAMIQSHLDKVRSEKECLLQSARNHIRSLEQDIAALRAKNETLKVPVGTLGSLLVENSMLVRKIENSVGDCYALQEDCDEMECQLDESLEVALQEVTARDDKIDLLESEIVRLRASIRNDVSAPATEGVVSSVTPAQEPRSKRQRQNETSNTAVDDVFSHTSIQDGSGAATALEYVSMDNGRGKMGPLSAVATASSSSSLPSSNTSNGRVVHSGSGSRQRASNTLQSLTFGALPRSSTDTTNASGVDWVSLVRNGGFPAAANNNNTFGNISNAAAGNNNNNHNSVAGIAATSTNQDNDNDSDSDNHVDHFAIGEKIGMKFIAVSVANHGEKTLAPLLITTNSCGNDNGGLPNVIGAVSSTIDLKIGSKSGWLAMDHGNISKPQPGVSHVVKPNLSYTRTNVGGIPQEKIYYQQQEVNQDETILIDGEKVVIPAGFAIEYCDGKILPLKYDQNLRNEYYSQRKSEITTLVALKDSEVEDSEDGKDDNGTTNYEVLAVLPCSQIVESVLGKAKRHAVKKTWKGVAYFDGDELKTVDVKFVKHQTEHGHVGRVSVLGTKILKRRYLVIPSYKIGLKNKNLKARKEESAKYRVDILEEIGITEEVRNKIYKNLVKLEDSLG